MKMRCQTLWLHLIYLFFLVGCDSGSSSSGPGNSPSGQTLSSVQVSQNADGSSLDISVTGPDSVLQIDGTPQFNTPIVNQAITTSSIEIPALANGLVPGTLYYVRTLPTNAQAQIFLQPPKWNTNSVGQSYFRAAWLDIGVRFLTGASGIAYVPNTGQDNPANMNPRWTVGSWSYGSFPTVPPSSNIAYYASDLAYYVQGTVTSNLYQASIFHDLVTLDELAQFYNVYFSTHFASLGTFRSIGTANGWDTSTLIGPDSTMTIVDVRPNGGSYQIWECPLCNEQFIHPIAQLLRVISQLSPAERTAAMLKFAQTYTSVVTVDQLLRDEYGIKPTTSTLVQQLEPTLFAVPNWVADWTYDATTTVVPPDPHWHAMTDNDLWLIAASAELLGANANDPQLVPLSAAQTQQLQYAVQQGLLLFQKKANFHSATQNFKGETVGSVSYFDGDESQGVDQEYAGYTGQLFPTTSPQNPQPPGTAYVPLSPVKTVSWDIDHYGRVPIVLRSLFDNLKAYSNLTGGFPGARDIILAVNQLVYVVMQPKTNSASINLPVNPGPFSLLFNNYMDGSNGWYRVGYHNPAQGIAPAQYCDSQTTGWNPLCLTNAGVVGVWGFLSAFQSDLVQIEAAFVSLAQAQDAPSVVFKDRYYFDAGYHFSFVDSSGNPQHPPSLTGYINNNAAFVP